MRVGILDFDTKKETNRFGRKSKYPNIACGKIYGWHKQRGDEIVYPWQVGQRVDILYVSAIFSNSAPTIRRLLPLWEQYAKKIHLGGSAFDDYSIQPYNITELPFYMAKQDPKWTYELYDIDYGIEFTWGGCPIGCDHCNVPKKEGLIPYQTHTIDEIINPRSKHIVLMNNNSFAAGFFEDIERIKYYDLSVHWDQANDITLLEPSHVEALKTVNYRGFTGERKQLFFAFDLMTRTVIEPETERVLHFDMTKVVPEKVRMMQELGIPPKHLTFYMLIGFNTTEEEDVQRVDILRELGCEIHPMVYMNIKGDGTVKKVDKWGQPQKPHVTSVRDWVHSKVYRTQPLHEFTKYRKRMKVHEIKQGQLALF